MSKRKRYNPFKMWGSWVGAVVLPIIIYTQAMPIYWLIHGACATGMACMPNPFAVAKLYAIFSIPIGFLLGWGIHSLCRKLR